jgi:hypothetical protein
MKRLLLSLLLLSPFITAFSQATVETLTATLLQRDYFLLEEQFEKNKATLPPAQYLYYQAYLDHAFNRNRDCIAHVDALFAVPSTFNDSTKVALLLLQSDSYTKCYEYAAAARLDSMVLQQYAHTFDSERLEEVKNSLVFRRALQNVPVQTMQLNSDELIKWRRNKMNLMELPVKTNGSYYDAILDTRADFSCVTESYAPKLGIRKLDVTVKEGSGITGINFNASLGVADSFYVGNILFQHVVFLIMPDEVLHLKQLFFNLQINLIVGAPLIEQLGELHISSKGTIRVPLKHTEQAVHNMATEFYSPVLRLKHHDDWLHLYIDLGASNTQLFPEYYKRYQGRIEQDARRKTVKLAGAGGSSNKETYVLPTVALSTVQKAITLDHINVLTDRVNNSHGHYGNLGQDFMRRFSEVVFNFREMYFTAE